MTSGGQQSTADHDANRIAGLRRLLLAAAITLAAVHALGILLGDPVLRYAEALALLLLLAYSLPVALSAPRGVLPAALTVLVVDAVHTVPAVPTGTYGWSSSGPQEPDMQVSFVTGLSLTWAPLLFVLLLLLLAWRGRGPRRRVFAVAALAAVLVSGYAAVRLGDVFFGTLDAQRAAAGFGYNAARTVSAAGLATLTPLALALAAIGLTALLVRQGRRLAAAGATLLAVAALPHLDAALEAVPMPVSVGDRTALFAWHAITPSFALPAPVPALTTAVELTAYVLLVIGMALAAEAGFSVAAYRRIDLLEVAGAIGLLIGLVEPLIGTLAGVGLLPLLAGALVVHLRKGDGPRTYAPAVVCGLLVAVYLTLHLVSAR